MGTMIDFFNQTFRTARRRVVALTADYTWTVNDNGTVFTNRGATAIVVITVPTANAGLKGCEFSFYACDNDGIKISGTAGELMAFNDAAANSVAISTTAFTIGGMMHAICDGTSWLVSTSLYDAGVASAQTVTIVT